MTSVDSGPVSAAAMIAAQRGASVFRVHDVAATRDVQALLTAVEHREQPP